MYMAYTSNPKVPRVRMDAVKLVRKGWSYRKVARYTGYTVGTIAKWVKKAGLYGPHGLWIPTESSRPKHSPKALPPDIVRAIVQQRLEHNRCAEVIHEELKRKGIVVSLSSVKRTLKREHLLKERSPWKRPHDATPRPEVVQPGDLVEVDTIHIVRPERFYVFTLLDVYSRWAHAAVFERIRPTDSLRFVHQAQKLSPFPFTMLQSDHGSEFSQKFTLEVGVSHRHSRVRKPNDNAHLERFNRTLQDECFRYVRPTPWHYRRALPEYLHYYNSERLHLSLNFQTPLQRFQGLD